MSQDLKVTAAGLPDTLRSLERWRAMLNLAPGLELPTASLVLTMAITPMRSLHCSLSELAGITGLSESNSLRLCRHLSELRWLTSSPPAVGSVDLQLTDTGFELALALCDASGGLASDQL